MVSRWVGPNHFSGATARSEVAEQPYDSLQIYGTTDLSP